MAGSLGQCLKFLDQLGGLIGTWNDDHSIIRDDFRTTARRCTLEVRNFQNHIPNIVVRDELPDRIGQKGGFKGKDEPLTQNPTDRFRNLFKKLDDACENQPFLPIRDALMASRISSEITASLK